MKEIKIHEEYLVLLLSIIWGAGTLITGKAVALIVVPLAGKSAAGWLCLVVMGALGYVVKSRLYKRLWDKCTYEGALQRVKTREAIEHLRYVHFYLWLDENKERLKARARES